MFDIINFIVIWLAFNHFPGSFCVFSMIFFILVCCWCSLIIDLNRKKMLSIVSIDTIERQIVFPFIYFVYVCVVVVVVPRKYHRILSSSSSLFTSFIILYVRATDYFLYLEHRRFTVCIVTVYFCFCLSLPHRLLYMICFVILSSFVSPSPFPSFLPLIILYKKRINRIKTKSLFSSWERFHWSEI